MSHFPKNLNLRRWLHEHSLKLLAIRDTPGAIAGGVAIGIFFGFTPLFGLKTLSAIFCAWLTRSNIIAAVIAGALHDVILPFMPVIYRWEYQVGYWLLSQPHHWPERLRRSHLKAHEWLNWTTFLNVGRPLLLGSAVCATPIALASFAITKFLLTRHQQKKPHPVTDDPGRSDTQTPDSP
jgi:uncharacterized protein (DUF2062 family)